MKKKPKERDWYIEAGFEIRKIGRYWFVHEGGYPFHSIKDEFSLEQAQQFARNVRKSRNEQA